jgi:hypothetical protein
VDDVDKHTENVGLVALDGLTFTVKTMKIGNVFQA